MIGGRDIWRKVFYSSAGHESQDRTDSAKEEKEGWEVGHADLQENIIGFADQFDLGVCIKDTNENEL